jgi:hypothetical protein
MSTPAAAASWTCQLERLTNTCTAAAGFSYRIVPMHSRVFNQLSSRVGGLHTSSFEIRDLLELGSAALSKSISIRKVLGTPRFSNRSRHTRVLTSRLFTANYFPLGLHEFDVTSDGHRFLMIHDSEGSRDQLTVVTNWQAALRK